MPFGFPRDAVPQANLCALASACACWLRTWSSPPPRTRRLSLPPWPSSRPPGVVADLAQQLQALAQQLGLAALELALALALAMALLRLAKPHSDDEQQLLQATASRGCSPCPAIAAEAGERNHRRADGTDERGLFRLTCST